MLVVPWIKKNCFMLTFQSWCLQFSDFSEINLGIQLVHNFSDIHSGIQVIHNFSEIHSYQISYKKLEPLSNFIIILDTTIAIAIAIATAITIASKTSGSIKTPASMMSSTPLRHTPPPEFGASIELYLCSGVLAFAKASSSREQWRTDDENFLIHFEGNFHRLSLFMRSRFPWGIEVDWLDSLPCNGFETKQF